MGRNEAIMNLETWIYPLSCERVVPNYLAKWTSHFSIQARP